MEDKRKHLEFIQANIARLSNTSFLLKGWSVTVVAGLFALGASERKASIPALAIVLTIIFWVLDAFFLWRERLYRALYDEVRQKRDAEIDFSLDASGYSDRCKWYSAPCSITLWPFYAFVLATVIIFMSTLK
jgi:hypothetical protein